MRQEIEKLRQLRALGLPDTLFEGVPVKVVTHYRQRASREPPRELRRHPPHVRSMLLAAWCWQRQREITDTLVDLLLHIAHRIGIRAEDKVDTELLQHLRKVAGKTKLLYTLAKVCQQHPNGVVQEVIYPVVGQQTIDDLVKEAEADSAYDARVRLVPRASYGHHYRRVVPALLDVLHFHCNNDVHRPVMRALALLEQHRDSTLTAFPRDEDVPLDGVVKDDWRDLVEDEKHPGRINRISYEVCLLSTLRDKVRCKEVWVQGAQRFRNPDEDLPQDFGLRREEYYAARGQPIDAKTFVETLRSKLETALATEWHARYGGPGIMVYWHVEERSVCIYSQLKSCSSSEVAATIERVLRHETDMEVEKNYVDTHGQSGVGFAFCYLLGFELLPRLKHLKKQRLYRSRPQSEGEPYAHIQAILTRPVQWALIAAQYDEMIKFATALRLGTADAESILRRFTRSNVQHPTYKALAELGKALKTSFLCDYLRLESLRRDIHEGLQVIEQWNSANDFILYGKGGEFASNKLEDQEIEMLSLHLLQVSLVYIHTLMIQQVLLEPAWQDRLTAADLRALTPLLWAHVNPYGTFTLDMNARLPLKQAA